jgi:hypothetical protein
MDRFIFHKQLKAELKFLIDSKHFRLLHTSFTQSH